MPTDTVVRAVTLPVGAPVGVTWDGLNEALTAAWRLSTHAANWCVQELYKRDTVGEARTPAAVKPRAKTNPAGFYAYGEAVAQPWAAGWVGTTKSLGCCLRAAHGKYLRDRFEVMVRHNQNLLTYRFPFPFPVHNGAWSAGYADGGFPTVTLPLPGLGRVTLRLKRRADFGRQLAMFRQLHDGVADKCEAALYRNGKGDLLVKLVGKFPRPDRGPADNVMFLHTDPNALLVAEVNGRSASVTNADHVRRALAVVGAMERRAAGVRPLPAFPGGGSMGVEELKRLRGLHAAFLERFRQDKKREVRMDRRRRRQLNRAVEARCRKANDRVKTFVAQVAAQVVRMCRRQGVGLVAYDDRAQSFFPSGFPWFDLKTAIRDGLDWWGVGWVDGEFVSLPSDERLTWLHTVRATVLAGRRAVANDRREGSHPKVATPSTGSTSRTRRRSPASARR